ncbi:MAG: hypothetical protein HZC02_04745 [Candidatus Levybacteria bacterium]|nr:hypothetical protein [Candidatus Levybacteria bacterium]
MKRLSASGFISTIVLIAATIGMILPIALPKPSVSQKNVLAATSVYVTGRILDIRGGNISGATVSISGSAYSSSQYSTSAGFAFIVPGNNSYTITANKSGFRNTSRFVTVGTSAVSTTITLQANTPSAPTPTPTLYTNLTICTYRSGGGPINGNVTIKNYSTVSTGSDGCAGYTFLRNQTLFISASANGYVSAAQVGVALTAANQTKTFYLTPNTPPVVAKTIKGQLILDKNSNGVADSGESGSAEFNGVSIGLTGENKFSKKTTTNSGGAFSFSNIVEPGRYTAHLNTPPPGFTSKYIGLPVDIEKTTTSKSITFLLRSTPATYTWTMTIATKERTTQNGKETDIPYTKDGCRFDVTPTTSGAGFSTKSLNCGPKGEVSISGLKAGSYKINFAVIPPGYTLLSENPRDRILDLEKSAHAPFTITYLLKAKTTPSPVAGKNSVQFTIKDKFGTGIPNQTVTLQGINGASGTKLTTDTKGFLKFTNVSDGTYTAIYKPSDGYVLTKSDFPASLNASKGTSYVYNYTVECPNGVNCGKKLGPLTKVTVCLTDANTKKDLKGIVTMVNSAGGTVDAPITGCVAASLHLDDTVKMTAKADNYQTEPRTVDVVNGMDPIRFALKPNTPTGIKIQIKTQYQSNVSSPAGDVYVTVCPTVVTGTGKATCPNGRTDSSGNLTLPVSANSNLTISASKSPYRGKKEIKTGTSNASYVVILTNSTTPSPVNTAMIGGTVSVSTATGTRPYAGQNVKVILGIDKAATTFTSTTGGYSFKNLTSPGNYSIKIEPPSGYEVTSKNPVSLVNPPSSPKSSEIVNFTIRLSNAGKNDNTIKGVAYRDENRNGKQDADEKPFGGIKINLGVTATKSTTTDLKGNYQFSNLAPGDYTVRPAVPSGYQGTTDWPGGQVGGATKSITRNFGIAPYPSPTATSKTVSGALFYDKNANGKIDENPESGDGDGGAKFNGATVRITGPGTSLTTKTAQSGASNGRYSFKDIKPGTYTVALQTIPSGFTLQGSSEQQVVVEATNIGTKPVNFLLKDTSKPITPPVSNAPSKTPSLTPSKTPSSAPSPKPSTQVIYSIKGQVFLKTKSSKQKYTGGKMNITATNTNNQHKTVKVAADGSYVIPSLTQKEYTVSTTAPTNTTLTTANNVKVTFNTNQTASVDFTLASTITPSPSPICLQVITDARNSSTNACQTFPTSCLPEGWVQDPTCSPTTISPSPSVSPSPVISPSISPSTEPSTAPSESPSPSPSVSPSPIPTDKTSLSFSSIFLDGIGKAGDSVAPNTVGNINPKRRERLMKVELTEATNDSNVIAIGQGNISYQDGPDLFTGTITLDKKVAAGTYSIKVLVDQHPKKKLKNAIVIVEKDTIIPVTEATYLVVGDIDGNGVINLLDYDIVTGCDESIVGNHCEADLSKKADLNDDGAVDFYDYNLFLREISVIKGDS